MATESLGKLIVETFYRDRGVKAGMKATERYVQGANQAIGGFARTVDRALSAALLAGTAALTAFGAAAVKTGAQFETSLATVGAVSNATAEDMQLLEDRARQLGESTAFTASQAADGMIDLARAGLSAAEVNEAVGASMFLAGAAGSSMSDATALTAATLQQFRFEADQATRVSDVFTAAMNNSLFDMHSLAEAFKYAGTTGAGFGLTLEETTAAVAQFRNLGLEGSLAGTNFRMTMAALGKVTQEGEKVLKKYGLTAQDVNVELHGFETVMRRIGETTMTTGESIDLFGRRAGTNAIQIARQIASTDNAYGELLATLQGSAGEAQSTYERMIDTVTGQFDILKSVVQELFLSLFDSVSGPLRRLMTELQDRVRFITAQFAESADGVTSSMDQIVDGVLALVDSVIRLSPHLGNIAKLMIAALVASKGVQYAIALQQLGNLFGVSLVAQIQKAITALRAMSAAQAAFTVTGLGLVLAGIAALTAALVKLGSSYTGAARDARKLGAELDAQAIRRATTAQEIEDLQATLDLTKAMIRQRIASGAAITNEQRALLKMNATTAVQKLRTGELLELHGELVPATQATTTELEKHARAAGSAAAENERLVEKLQYLEGQYEEAGIFDSVNDAMQGSTDVIAGVLTKAREVTGENIRSYEELVQALEMARAKAKAYRAEQEGLSNVIAEKTAAQKEDTKATDDGTKATDDGAGAAAAATVEEKKKFLTHQQAAEVMAQVAEQEKELEAARQKQARATEIAQEASARARNELEALKTLYPQITKQTEDLSEEMGVTFTQRVEQLGDTLRDGLLGALQAVGKAAPGILSTLGNATASALGALGSMFTGFIGGLAGQLMGILELPGLQDILDVARDNEDLAAQLEEQGMGDKAAAVRDRAGGAASAAGQDFAQAILDALSAIVTMVGPFVEAFVAEVPAIMTAIADAIPQILDAVIAAIPPFIQAVVDGLPPIVQALLDAIPDLIAALTEGILTIVDVIPVLVRKILKALPDIITALVEAIPTILDAVVKMLPKLLTAIIENIPLILEALIAAIPVLVLSIVEAIPDIIMSLLAAIPDLVSAVVSQLPLLITTLIAMIPDLIISLAQALPELLPAMYALIPLVLAEIIMQLPSIVIALVDSLIFDLIARIPEIAFEMGKALVDQAFSIGKAIGEALLDAVGSLFGLGGGKGDGDGFLDTLGGIFGLQSGIENVPRTMIARLEPGEAVLDAETNARRMAGRTVPNLPAPAPVAAAQGGESIEVVVVAESRVLDAVQARGVQRGHMPKLARARRRSSGVKIGFNRGRLNLWSG